MGRFMQVGRVVLPDRDRVTGLSAVSDMVRLVLSLFSGGGDVGLAATDLARVEGRLDAGIAAVRSDIVQLALAVGGGPRTAQG